MAEREFVKAAQMEELRAALRDVSDEIGDLAVSLMEDIGSDVVSDARSRVPYLTGKARASYRISGTAITFGGDQAPYVPWLEFGGKVGRRKSTKRPYVAKGRYLYPAIADNAADVERKVDDLISQITGGYLEVEGS